MVDLKALILPELYLFLISSIRLFRVFIPMSD